MQITKYDQEAFYKYLEKEMPVDRATDIADNYAWESAVWEWALCKKGEEVIMNNYVIENKDKDIQKVFLITQYFINGYLSKEKYKYFNGDLREIKNGETNYDMDFKKKWVDGDHEYTGVLIVNGREYRLPVNYADRLENFYLAMEVFAGETYNVEKD